MTIFDSAHPSHRKHRRHDDRINLQADPMKKLKIIIITGLSGSGKSISIAALEDAGFYCVDNMPVKLLPKFLELPIQKASEIKGLGFVMDLREKSFVSACPGVFDELRKRGYDFDILFLEADETTLLKRYSQTRRHHPLTQDKSLLEGIRVEKTLMAPLRSAATRIINTTDTNIHDLKSIIFNIARERIEFVPMRINIVSFGFKHGTPHEADLIMDVRFLGNPYFVSRLKPLDGRNDEVKHFVLNNPVARTFIHKFLDMIDFLLPLYEKEGKAYLTVAIGCTGGQHRSVSIAEAIYEHIRQPGRPINITHRDIDSKI